MKSCRTCKTSKDCDGREFFTYSEIRWCPHQILWLLEHAEILESGRWPLNPESSGYIDSSIKTGYASEGYFVKPVEIIGEVNRRLTSTNLTRKQYGEKFIIQVELGEELSEESKLILLYIRGWRQKRMSYSDWRKQRVYRGKK